jgi:uracil-DNA glycosylase
MENFMDSNFTPVIWPEDKVPEDAIYYKQCEVCTPKSRIIWGEGNPKAPIVIILDNPGAREDKEGKEFVCGTRQTLQLALNKVNLKTEDIYITYLLKCRPLKKYNKEEVRSFSKPFLLQQIDNIKPEFLILLGDTVVQSIFDDNEAHVKNLRGSWHHILGYPIIVSYHPLAVRRRPNLMNYFMQDFEMLAQRFHSN